MQSIIEAAERAFSEDDDLTFSTVLPRFTVEGGDEDDNGMRTATFNMGDTTEAATANTSTETDGGATSGGVAGAPGDGQTETMTANFTDDEPELDEETMEEARRRRRHRRRARRNADNGGIVNIPVYREEDLEDEFENFEFDDSDEEQRERFEWLFSEYMLIIRAYFLLNDIV